MENHTDKRFTMQENMRNSRGVDKRGRSITTSIGRVQSLEGVVSGRQSKGIEAGECEVCQR